MSGLKFTKTPAKATKTVATKSKGKAVSEETTEEVVDVPETVTSAAKGATGELCRVGYANSYTHNLGDYCSTRIEYSLFIPCAHSEIDEAGNYAEEWVQGRLKKAVEELG